MKPAREALPPGQEEVFQAIKKNPRASYQEIADTCNVTIGYIYSVLKVLAQKGYLKSPYKTTPEFQVIDEE